MIPVMLFLGLYFRHVKHREKGAFLNSLRWTAHESCKYGELLLKFIARNKQLLAIKKLLTFTITFGGLHFRRL